MNWKALFRALEQAATLLRYAHSWNGQLKVLPLTNEFQVHLLKAPNPRHTLPRQLWSNYFLSTENLVISHIVVWRVANSEINWFAISADSLRTKIYQAH